MERSGVFITSGSIGASNNPPTPHLRSVPTESRFHARYDQAMR